MNERIKELFDKSVKYTASQDDGTKNQVMMNHICAEKFAELIVQECMNQVREQYLPVLEDEVMMKDIYWAHYVQFGIDCYVAIEEHFGVEE